PFTVGQLPYPPIILAQPQSQSVIIGSNVTFIVSVSGLPFPSYQWRKNGSPISGATRFFYSLTGVTTNDAGNYDVSVSNTLYTFMSDVAVLQVVPYREPLAITQSPLSRTLGAG